MNRRPDRGASAIFVVIAMPVLILAGALVFDGGRGILARRETQNAADAGALAKATDCAKSISTTDFTPYQTNGALLANTPVCEANGTTTVSMRRTITFAFSSGGGTADVTRSATAQWSALTTARGVFPITIGACALSGVKTDSKVTLRARTFPGSLCPSPAGQFGWTDINCSSPSTVTVGTGFGIDGTTGNTPKACTISQLDSFIGQDMLVPVWDQNTTNCGHTYCLTTFVLFHMTGWSGNGNTFGSPPSTLLKACDGSGDQGVNFAENTPCIRGVFKQFTTQVGDFGPGTCNTQTVLYACRIYLSS